MLNDLFSRRAEIVVENDKDTTSEYKVVVSGPASKGGNAANVALSGREGETVIEGSVGGGNKDNFVIKGKVQSVEGAVSVSTREVMSADYTGVVALIGAMLALGAYIGIATN
jgi:hypothetical protein